MESFPLRLMLVMAVILFSIQVCLSMMDLFTTSLGNRRLLDSVSRIIGTMDVLEAGDHGSFDFVEVHVPAGNLMRVDSSSDMISTRAGNYTLQRDLHNDLVLGPGEYELRVYYGSIEGELTLSFD